MYPLDAPAPWIRNQCYVAGLASEFGRALVARTILDDPLVFFRTESGQPVALWGLCPHRLMPLEFGTLTGDQLACTYHGFVFGPDGRCVSIPTATRISSACRLRSYPVVERGPFLWIWMGERKADEALLPDASDIGLGASPGVWHADTTRTFRLNARAQLLIDNLLDLSHLAFLHANSVTGGEIALVPPAVDETGGAYRVTRLLENIEPPAFFRWLMPDCPDRVSSALSTDVYSSALINAAGPWVWAVGADGTRGELIGRVNFVHAITPETRHSTHYFGVVTRDFRGDDAGLSAALSDQNDRVRAEDVRALAEIERYADRYGDLKREVSVPADVGALAIRRRINKAIAVETARD